MKKKMRFASISGGKDSVAMCLKLVEYGWPVDNFVFCDTGMEYPECYAALDRFEKLTGRKITRLKGNYSFEELLATKPLDLRGNTKRKDGSHKRECGYGWPSMMRRWCTSKLKQDVMKRFYRNFKDYEIVEMIGIAADEPKRVHEKIYPLVKWGMTESECMRYCKDRGFYASPCAYDRVGRMSCFCCPLMNRMQIRYLIRDRPELWLEIKRLENLVGEPFKDRGTLYFEKLFM